MEIKAIADLKQRLVDLKERLPEITIEVARRNEAAIVDIVTESQLNQGTNASGKQIMPRYRPFTVRIKRMKGQPFDRVTLKDTGDFHKSVELRFGSPTTNWVFVVAATDSKLGKLERKYGNDILGISSQSMLEVNDILRDEIISEASKLLIG